MDLTGVDMNVLAPQLRKPQGEYGRQVGAMMAEKNMKVTAFTLECCALQPRDHVLEIGFGPGEGIAQAVALTPHGYVAGIDYSPEMLDMAESRNHRAVVQEHVELTLGDAISLSYEDESFDVVFAVNVFHFWPDPTPYLAECRRVLKPGGRIAFFMAYPSAYMPGLRETGVFIAREPVYVEKLLTDAGFVNATHKDIVMQEFRGFAVRADKA